MKIIFRSIFACLFCCLFSKTFAQKTFPWGKTADEIILKNIGGGAFNLSPVIDCDPIGSSPGCTNLILNNNFTPTPAYDPTDFLMYSDPFTTAPAGVGYVPDWLAAQGTPNLDDTYSRSFLQTVVLPPSPATGYAFMFAGTYNGNLINEGIAQKIGPLVPGNKYIFSFFEKVSTSPNYTDVSANLNIVLMNCSDYSLIYPQPDIFITPGLPQNSQQIYCETGVSHLAWQQKTFSFIANSAYDMIWIYASNDFIDNVDGAAICFAYPELKDVTGFTAGLNPVISNSCTVTIGPNFPNACTTTNAVFTWHGPNGQIVSAPPNQKIQVDASDPLNVGTWTLKMTAPSEIATNNSCSQTLSASVIVPGCNFWPKVYSTGDSFFGLLSDNNGNVMASMYGLMTGYTNYNHVGTFPSSTVLLNACIQFTTAGITNWYTNNGYTPNFAFQSGIVQLGAIVSGGIYDSYFVNGTTGVTVSPPSGIPLDEVVLAETTNGTIITYINQTLKVYSPSGNSQASLSGVPNIYKFNRSTNTLYLSETIGGNDYFTMRNFNGTTFGTPTVLSSNNPILPYIDNTGNFYYISGGVLMEYDYTTSTGSSVSVTGLNNSNLQLSSQGYRHYYTQDKMIVFNSGDNYIYAIDFPTMTATKVFTTNFASGKFVIEGDMLYLAENWNNTPTSSIGIGSQTIPLPLSTQLPFFITKLSLQNDFSRQASNGFTASKKQEEQLKITLAPNPSVNIINVNVLKQDKQSNENYAYFVTNRNGKVVWQCKNCPPFIQLNISNWEKGVYHIEAINARNEKTVVPFLKL